MQQKMLTAFEIAQRFNETAEEIELAQINKEINALQAKINMLRRKQNELIDKSHHTADDVADQLDIECPGWRNILARTFS